MGLLKTYRNRHMLFAAMTHLVDNDDDDDDDKYL
jgi:hypothetical protein